MPCKKLWTVKTDDLCFNISIANTISEQYLYAWNPALDTNCTNLHDKRWGSVLCVSPDSRLANGTNNGPLNPWTNGDGVGGAAVSPPAGSSVATGTTLQCAGWYSHNTGQSCTEICMKYKIVFSVLTAANPSLHNTTCDDDLVLGKTYCVHPSANWTDIPSPTLPPSPTIIDFNEGKMDGWTVYDGLFDASERVLTAKQSGSGKAVSPRNSPTLTWKQT